MTQRSSNEYSSSNRGQRSNFRRFGEPDYRFTESQRNRDARLRNWDDGVVREDASDSFGGEYEQRRTQDRDYESEVESYYAREPETYFQTHLYGQNYRYSPTESQRFKNDQERRYGHEYFRPQSGEYYQRPGLSNRGEADPSDMYSFRGKGPKGYQRSNDRINEEVCDALADHPGIDATNIEVTVEGGLVTLSGTVTDRRSKRLAEDCCEQIRGVNDVNNMLQVAANKNASESNENKSSDKSNMSRRLQ